MSGLMVMRGFIGQSSQCKQQVTHFSLGGSNGEASMVIESVEQFQEKESLIAALKIIALGEKDRLQGKGFSVEASRAQLLAARQRRK